MNMTHDSYSYLVSTFYTYGLFLVTYVPGDIVTIVYYVEANGW